MNSVFGTVEHFYSFSIIQIQKEIISKSEFKRYQPNTVQKISLILGNFLQNKGIFKDSTIISENTYSVGIRKRLISFGLLTYTDLAYYFSKLTEGERRYFYSMVIGLPGMAQQNSFKTKLQTILLNNFLSVTDNPIMEDWDQVGITNKNTILKLSEFGILTVEDLIRIPAPLNSVWDILKDVFSNNKSLFLNTISGCFTLCIGSLSVGQLIPLGGRAEELELYNSNYSFNSYLVNGDSDRLSFEKGFGLNSQIHISPVGQQSGHLKTHFLLRPFLVEERTLSFISLTNPILESLYIILAVINNSPSRFRVGARIGCNIVVRTTINNSALRNEMAPEVPSYKPLYLQSRMNQNTFSSEIHAMDSDELWTYACNVDVTNSNFINIYTISLGYSLINMVDSVINNFSKCFLNGVAEDYSNFHQILGWDIYIIVSENMSVYERSLFYKQVEYVYNQTSFFSDTNGIRLNPLPNRFIYETGRVRTPFTYDLNDEATNKLVKQLMAYSIIFNSILIKRNIVDFTPINNN